MAQDKRTSSSEDAGRDEVQKRVDEANKQGFYGVEVDETPNENYSVEGVTSGKPTPETSSDK